MSFSHLGTARIKVDSTLTARGENTGKGRDPSGVLLRGGAPVDTPVLAPPVVPPVDTSVLAPPVGGTARLQSSGNNPSFTQAE